MLLWEKARHYLHDHLSQHYWDGEFKWKRQHQLVYTSHPPSRPEFIPITAPYICATTPYDDLGFWEFPARTGWKINRSDRRCHSGRCPPGTCVADGAKSRYGLHAPCISRTNGSGAASVTEKVAFLQAWLFFGALKEVCSLCGLEFDPREILVSGETISTAWLNGLPLRLFIASQQRRLAGTSELRLSLYAIARHIQLMITRADEFEDEHQYTFSECQILWSIHILLRIILLSFLCHSSTWHVDPKDDLAISVGDVRHDWAHEGEGRMAELMFARLLDKGWCKSELSDSGNSMMFFNYFVERPEGRRNHGECVETRCMASQTNEEDYQTLHVIAQCKCGSVEVDSERLRDSLAGQRIPKIIISRDLELSVVQDEDYPYIAISHVWADGLGNPFSNSLPRCQLRRLKDFARALSSVLKTSRRRPLALWMDTLCIPVAPQLKEHRKLAIRLLAQTYHDATAVLVLDRELCSIKSEGVSDLELGIRVISGGWMKRLWTLQEAALSIESKGNPGKMYFQMEDGPIHWSNLVHTFQHVQSKRRHDPPRPPNKPNALVSSVREIKDFLLFKLWVDVSISNRIPSVSDLQPWGWSTQFQRLADAVQNRITSKSEDEAICLASLAGLDVSRILNVQTAEDRMQQFYLLLREIPTAVIFLQLPTLRTPDHIPTPCMEKAPFRWAPRSLLLHSTEVMIVHHAYAAQSFADVKYHLFGICEPDGLHIQHGGFIFLQSKETTRFQQSCDFEDANGKEKYFLTRYDATGSEAPNMAQTEVALIFETTVCSTVAIVSIQGRRNCEDGPEIYVTILGHGSVSTLENLADGEVLQGSLTPINQKWCLT